MEVREMAESFSKVAMEVVVSIILLCAVALPIIGSMTVPEGIANGDIISTLIGIIPVLLAVAIILGVVYAVITRRSD
ncbi:MAG: hypothetical protein J5485_03680 [Candidatus Methanomethylophilaceae archaeon]|nr:hypothetical protein [Candidatus Methanomethylophilaceae archaeon]